VDIDAMQPGTSLVHVSVKTITMAYVAAAGSRMPSFLVAPNLPL
jgi:hypothetical protein